MKKLTAIVLLISLYSSIGKSQQAKKNETPAFTIAPNGALVIKPSASSSSKDFDFMDGNWEQTNHKLKDRLVNSKEWIDFPAKLSFNKILNGIGNTDHFYATIGGKSFEGFTLRLFNPQTRLWSIYWAASGAGVLEPEVVGSFNGNIGTFYGRDTEKGKNIIVQYKWDKTNPKDLKWSQAFSADEGKTWEWNWYMHEWPAGTKGKSK